MAVLLAGLLVAGLAPAGQRAFTHTFSDDENANFLALVETIKVHLALAKANASTNLPVAHGHVEHTMMHLDANTPTKELAEKNKRSQPTCWQPLTSLARWYTRASQKRSSQSSFSVVNGSLGEAVGARVDKKQSRQSVPRRRL